MNNRKIILPVLLLAIVLAAAWAALNFLSFLPTPGSDTPTPSQVEAQKTAAPDFEMTDAEGNVVRLSDFRGKAVILNFWASWCPPCKEEMPHFQAAYEEHGEEIVFIMLNLLADSRETPEKAAEFIADNGYSFPVYSDTKNEAASLYSVTSVPRTYTIDAEGNLVASMMGTFTKAKQLDAYIEQLLSA